MPKHIFPLLLVSLLLVTGCVNTTPSTPPLTEQQMKTALSETEQRLSQSMIEQCETLLSQQQMPTDELQQLQQGQQQVQDKLDLLEQKLNQHQQKLVAVSEATKPAECPQPSITSKDFGNKLMVGEVEWLWIEAVNRVYEARIDTGATTSSISATQITPFEKDGKRWVRFQLAPDDSEFQYEIEAPLVRYVRIRQASTEELDRRPVAKLTVRLGNLTEMAEFTLTDRSDMSYPILLGREFLRDIAVVDVSRKNVQPKPEIVSGQPEVKSVTKPEK